MTRPVVNVANHRADLESAPEPVHRRSIRWPKGVATKYSRNTRRQCVWQDGDMFVMLRSQVARLSPTTVVLNTVKVHSWDSEPDQVLQEQSKVEGAPVLL